MTVYLLFQLKGTCIPARQLTSTVSLHQRHQTPREHIPSHPMKCARSRTVSFWPTLPQPTTKMTKSTELTALEMIPDSQSRNVMASAPQQMDLTLLFSHKVKHWRCCARDTFRIETTACSCSVQNECKCHRHFGQRVFSRLL